MLRTINHVLGDKDWVWKIILVGTVILGLIYGDLGGAWSMAPNK